MEENELVRRTKASGSREEGLDIWNKHKDSVQEQNKKDKQELRDMLGKYSPWGRPGGGAPNVRGVRMRNIRLEELVPNIGYTMQPPDTGVRFAANGPTGGGGAPVIGRSGHLVSAFRQDPQLRFQFSDDMRQAVDNDLRYHATRKEKYKYKKQLDAMVNEKRVIREMDKKRNLDLEKKVGWSDERCLRKYELSNSQQNRNTGNNNQNAAPQNTPQVVQAVKPRIVISPPGGELVPLLARRRALRNISLISTDVTKPRYEDGGWRDLGTEYLHELTRQMSEKRQRKQITRQREAESCRRHFDTWGSLWGRPGHGAPRGNCNKLLDLHTLLYAVVK